MNLKSLIFGLTIGLLSGAVAQADSPQEKFKCGPELDCHFLYMQFETNNGTRYLRSELSDGFKFIAKFTSDNHADGAVQVNYEGIKCSFAISIHLEKTAVGYKVISEETPIPGRIYQRCPPPAPKVIQIHPHTYMSEAKRDQLLIVSNIVLLDPKNTNPNRAFAGSWRFESRLRNFCSDQKHLDQLQFNCDAPSGPQVQVSRRLNESSEKCFQADVKLPLDLVLAIKFESVKQCQSAIKALREMYSLNFNCNYPGLCLTSPIYWNISALKATGRIITSEQASTGAF